MFRKDWTIIGSFALSYTFQPAIAWLENKVVDVKPLVSHVLPLADFAAGFSAFAARRDTEGSDRPRRIAKQADREASPTQRMVRWAGLSLAEARSAAALLLPGGDQRQIGHGGQAGRRRQDALDGVDGDGDRRDVAVGALQRHLKIGLTGDAITSWSVASSSAATKTRVKNSPSGV